MHNYEAYTLNKTYGRRGYNVTRWLAEALEAVQEALEALLCDLFTDTVLADVHPKRVTIIPKDMLLCRQLRGESNKIVRD